MRYDLKEGNLLLKGKNSFILIGRAKRLFILFIETFEKELCQTVREDDLIAVSAPEGGDPRQAFMLLELIREYNMPVMVLPKGHPGSGRLNMVVSAGPEIIPGCGIMRGTHPEQNVICASEEFSGFSFYSDGGFVRIESGLLGRVADNSGMNIDIVRIPDSELRY
ncbi:hypothetical protein [Methanoplanus endosymbiosus]|uniref:Uncharacterized protein n=1 Tax=Methanoplanus endosymbiosus TaxID=33865 RepID=A0A9E7TLJ1_9EURY|nr:hypothetical protein [Methanoplanus endosymbiosus]UUX93825.1 hypothetical protein L6E24_06840 [Methanoplanus endosymbiosus]